jgi:hypothetical protein
MTSARTNSASEPPLPSNRQFGIVFIVFFSLLGVLGLWRGGWWTSWLFGAAALVALITLFMPAVLTPFNRWWMRLAALLHKVVSPIVLGLMYFAILTPVAFAMRLAGRDEMKRRWLPQAPSYWVPRDPPGPPPGSLNNQF